jgi:hypothetical protein
MFTAFGSAVAALLLTGCGESARGWEEADDYRYTLSLFDGDCGDQGTGSWALTVTDGEVTGSEPLDEAARRASWAEGAPTIGELLENAEGVRADGAYDTVDIDFVRKEGPETGRPTRIYYLDQDDSGRYEGCERISSYEPAD